MLITDIEPLKAMEIFYDGAESGLWEGEFIKNQKKRGLVYPSKLREFLHRFGFLGVNSSECRFCFPDQVRIASIPFEDKSRDMLILGSIDGNHDDDGDGDLLFVGIFADECYMDNPPVSIGEVIVAEDGNRIMSFGASGMFLSDVLTYLFIENLTFHAKGITYDQSEIYGLLKKYPAEACRGEKSLEQLLNGAPRPCRYICYDEEENRFYCFDMGAEGSFVSVFSPYIDIDELESCFSKEFYENSINCDFAHALSLIEKIIDRLEQEETEPLKLGERYRLAGRCCWALNQWDKAEEWLKRAEPIFNSESAPPGSVQNYYEGLGNFYSDMGDEEKSAAAYGKAERIAEESGGNIFRLRGDILLRKGMNLAEKDCLEEAIEYFEKALGEYQKNPRECKYDIARCGQLKGDAKHKLKERKKQMGQ